MKTYTFRLHVFCDGQPDTHDTFDATLSEARERFFDAIVELRKAHPRKTKGWMGVHLGYHNGTFRRSYGTADTTPSDFWPVFQWDVRVNGNMTALGIVTGPDYYYDCKRSRTRNSKGGGHAHRFEQSDYPSLPGKVLDRIAS